MEISTNSFTDCPLVTGNWLLFFFNSRPNIAAIQAVIDRHLSAAPDLYQRGIDPETGEVTLRYFFPATAAVRDAAAIAQISAAIGIPVTVWPQPHQGQLAEAALAVVLTAKSDGQLPSLPEYSQGFDAVSEHDGGYLDADASGTAAADLASASDNAAAK